MLYWLLRWISHVALRWYYRDIRVVGAERIPRTGAVIFAVNHPNALVDALVAGCAVPRRLRMTGKATLFENPLLGALLSAAGVVPLRRVSDERTRTAGGPLHGTAAPPARNAESFRALGDVLESGGAMLIFPEGKSHSEPSIAPLKTGVARIAIEARDLRGVRDLRIVPLGLVFERKEEPRTRVLVQVGEPIPVGSFRSDFPVVSEVEALTARVERGLRDVTLNFDSPAHAERVLAVADVISAVADERRTLGEAEPAFTTVLDTVRRIEAARVSMEARPVNAPAGARVDAFLARLDKFQLELHELHIVVSDVRIDVDVKSGARFALREGAILAIVGPAALWGRINHVVPMRAARVIALFGATDRDQPAMRTLVAGLVLVLVAYAVQTALVAQFAGAWAAAAYLMTLPIFASWDLRLADRTRSALARVRAYFLFRRDTGLRARLRAEGEWLRSEAAMLEDVLTGEEGEKDRPDPSATPRAALRSADP